MYALVFAQIDSWLNGFGGLSAIAHNGSGFDDRGRILFLTDQFACGTCLLTTHVFALFVDSNLAPSIPSRRRREVWCFHLVPP